ncbi:alpha/beta hydrolase [Nocardia aurea]|uniref:alpha/beta hydrolase n=1 Tax=Nocardia aurea TaxID=2144174 RepID=UPI0033B58965
MSVRARPRPVGLVALVALAAATMLSGGTGHADPGPRHESLTVYSAAMGHDIHLDVLLPPRPRASAVLVLLDGADAANDSGNRTSDWITKTDAAQWFSDKNITVALPVGGRGSYYTDWQRPDPVLGVNRWETFLTEELPGAMVANYAVDTTRTAIAGTSMGGHAALTLAARHPGEYRSVAAFSSCPSTADPRAQQSIRLTVASRGGNPDLMWGPSDDPQWRDHDPLLLAENLRGTDLLITVGAGRPDPRDSPGDTFGGAPLEWGANMCTREFEGRLRELGIPATFAYRPTGLHAWPSWETDLHNAWPQLADSLDIPDS